MSASKLAAAVRYIENQERHHAKRDFEAEFLELFESMVWNSIGSTCSVSVAPLAL